jgi:hypothetical protein
MEPNLEPKDSTELRAHIDRTEFGVICIEGQTYRHDVVIRLNGSVKKRKKKLSKALYGTSHLVSIDEAKHIYDKGAVRLIIGSGQYGKLELSDDANRYFARKSCRVKLMATPKAIEAWNESRDGTIGLFHVTC